MGGSMTRIGDIAFRRSARFGPLLAVLALSFAAPAASAGPDHPRNAALVESAQALQPQAAVAATASASNGAIRPGFTTNQLAGNDDGSTSSVSLPFAIDFYGHTYSRLYVNNNGNLTMTAPLGAYTPHSLNQLGQPMIAPFWADVDT